MKLPKSWSEVTIRQVILTSDIESDEEMNDIEKMAMTLSIMGNIPITEVNQMPLIKTREAMGKMEFLKEQPSNKFINDFEIDGDKYYINPDIAKITNEQFQAFDFFTKEQSEVTKNLHNIMAIICLKKDEPYTMTTAHNRAKLFYDKMTFDVVAPVSFFFSQLLIQSQEHILHSLESRIDKTILENQKLIKELQAEV
jgi:hypothetical protein